MPSLQRSAVYTVSMTFPSKETTIFMAAAASSVVVLLLFTISTNTSSGNIESDTKENRTSTKKWSDKREIDSTSAPLSSLKDSLKFGSGEPMFDYHNVQSTQTVLKMAKDRAKRWMSFQVSECCRMVGQVGGKSEQKRPLLTVEPDFVLKPVNMDHRGIREVAFYEAIEAASTKKRSSNSNEIYRQLFGPRDLRPMSRRETLISWLYGRQKNAPKPTACCKESLILKETSLLRRLELFTPEYFGVVEYTHENLRSNETGNYGTDYNSHLLLHNLTSHFSRPCVVDLKMGTETFEPDAPADKKLREKAKYPAQVEMGFRLVAMRIYNNGDTEADEDGYIYFPKTFGRSLERRDSVKRALRKFFGGSDLPTHVQMNRGKAIKRILTQLNLIKKWFKDNTVFMFSASSILLVYEGDTHADEESDIQLDLGTAKMIDFGRVRRNPGGDFGYLKGVRTLIQLLEEILMESFWTEEYKYLE
ncbi:inositol polyphosphate kinase [Nitzschia inconspicua]|uniref:Kinase n=1 Tax=Nitzschia inconspicua TaxID=303405 RepID=A0A9K3L5M0_9STRA|nr:inositol polyphosphate kinase [Nitzschia inconspicua]